MKIKVKDYYAIKRGNKRSEALSKEERVEIARNAIKKRWENYRQIQEKMEYEEDKKYIRKIVK